VYGTEPVPPILPHGTFPIWPRVYGTEAVPYPLANSERWLLAFMYCIGAGVPAATTAGDRRACDGSPAATTVLQLAFSLLLSAGSWNGADDGRF
jgi:hypothetical protein